MASDTTRMLVWLVLPGKSRCWSLQYAIKTTFLFIKDAKSGLYRSIWSRDKIIWFKSRWQRASILNRRVICVDSRLFRHHTNSRSLLKTDLKYSYKVHERVYNSGYPQNSSKNQVRIWQRIVVWIRVLSSGVRIRPVFTTEFIHEDIIRLNCKTSERYSMSTAMLALWWRKTQRVLE